MGSAKIKTTFLAAAFCVLTIIEVTAGAVNTRACVPGLWTLAATRAGEIMLLVWLAKLLNNGIDSIGLAPPTLWPGIRKGLFWSGCFAVGAGLMFTGLYLAGKNPLTMIRAPLPLGIPKLFLFFSVGGILAPVAEEVFFRGIVYGYLRRWGVGAAVLLSTALFAAFHPGPAIPVTQIVGGVVFALAYEKEKSLMAPIVIHVAGNLAIFFLSLPLVQSL